MNEDSKDILPLVKKLRYAINHCPGTILIGYTPVKTKEQLINKHRIIELIQWKFSKQ